MKLPILTSSATGGCCLRRAHVAQVDRLRQEHPGRVLLPAVQTDRFRQAHRQSAAVGEAVRVPGQTVAQALQERLLQRRRRNGIRLQREAPHYGDEINDSLSTIAFLKKYLY